MKITDKYILFFSKSDMMSNFYPHEFIHMNKTFKDSETAFMWRKAVYFKDYQIAGEILNSKHPNHAKSLGRKVKGFNDEQWSKVRFDIMKEVVSDKVNQFDDLNEFIKKYKHKKFVEASPYDNIWGVKLNEHNPKILNEENWNGLNLLGEVYDEIKLDL